MKQFPITPSRPVLYHKGKGGQLWSWRIWVEGDTIFTAYGQEGGKVQITPGKVCKPMNEGKANERTAEQQAESVADSMHKFKLDRKYSLTPEGATDAKGDLPMLAHRYDHRPKHIKFPCDTQPKMDGNRAAARWIDGGIQLVSRSGVDTYDLPHLTAELERFVPAGYELDGELYIHGVHPNTINSWVNKCHPGSADIEFWCYDVPVVAGRDDLTWDLRDQARRDLFPNVNGMQKYYSATIPLERQHGRMLANKIKPCPHIIYVPTYRVRNSDEVDHWFEQFIADGYEGSMLRNLHGVYEWGDRSNHLQKVKKFEDAEFKIVGCDEGVGKMAGCAIWVCETADHKKFSCAMKAPMEERAKQWRERAKYIGSMMTVSFFGKFPTGIPRFPRAIKFRSAKDT